MSRKSTVHRIVTTAVATLTLAATAASSAQAEERAITSDPDPNVISCTWGTGEVWCKFGKIIVGCKIYAGSSVHCAAVPCGCSGAERPDSDELALRTAVEEVELYVERTLATTAVTR